MWAAGRRAAAGWLNWAVWPVALLLWGRLEHHRDLVQFHSIGGEVGRRLLVVMPFARDVDLLERNIRRWAALPPSRPGLRTHRHVDLLLYYHRDFDLYPERERVLRLVAAVRGSFRSAGVISAYLGGVDDRYPVGPSRMFFKLMLETPLVQERGYSYLFWMEPDCFPVQPGWLDRLYQRATSSGAFWMMGSLRRGAFEELKQYEHIKAHINGNALYRLDDPSFLAYLEAVQEDFDQRMSRYVGSFDLAIYLFWRGLEPYHRVAALTHRFVYTDLVQNVYITPTSIAAILQESPGTYLVHGRALLP